MLFLTALATMLIVYVIYAIAKGEVYARGSVGRDDSPQAFWTAILFYMAIGVALLILV